MRVMRARKPLVAIGISSDEMSGIRRALEIIGAQPSAWIVGGRDDDPIEALLVQEPAQGIAIGAPAGYAGISIAFLSNLMNNLPAGLIASSTVMQAHSPERVIDALLIGVDLGPNLSITGSLATILWLSAIRREGEDVSFMKFLKVGVPVMLPALALALAARVLTG